MGYITCDWGSPEEWEALLLDCSKIWNAFTLSKTMQNWETIMPHPPTPTKNKKSLYISKKYEYKCILKRTIQGRDLPKWARDWGNVIPVSVAKVRSETYGRTSLPNKDILFFFFYKEKLGKTEKSVECEIWILRNFFPPTHSLPQGFCCRYSWKIGSGFCNFNDYINCLMSELLASMCFVCSTNVRLFKVS